MALSGIRVVDLTRILAGPFCTMLLADMGADVIKIESPGRGDPVRGQGATRNGLSWYFAQFNRNKRSVCLNLRSEAGLNALCQLIKTADVLVENYRPGVLDAMGLDEAHLKVLNPRLIVTHINGYGSTGPYKDRPSFDFIAQAMSGFMSVNGEPAGAPMRSGQPISDLTAGLYAAFGTVTALFSRERTGAGQNVESTLLTGLISMMAYLSAQYFESGQVPERTGNDHPVVAPYGLFHASDGDVAIAPSNDEFVHRLFQVLDLMPLLGEPDYATNTLRMKNRQKLHAEVNERIANGTVDHWIKVINEAGVPCGRVMNLHQVFTDPQVLHQQMVLDVPHGEAGTVRMTGFPVHLSDTPAQVRYPAPGLGEHTDEILEELKFSKRERAALLSAE